MPDKTDGERLDWLQAMHTLHQSVEFTYTAAFYVCAIVNGKDPWRNKEFEGETMREAIDKAMENEYAQSDDTRPAETGAA